MGMKDLIFLLRYKDESLRKNAEEAAMLFRELISRVPVKEHERFLRKNLHMGLDDAMEMLEFAEAISRGRAWGEVPLPREKEKYIKKGI